MTKLDNVQNSFNISVEGSNFFSGLRFLIWDTIKDYADWVDMNPQSYYTLQFNRNGPMQHQFPGQRMQQFEGSYAWVTTPGHYYHFGAPKDRSRHHYYVSFNGPRVKSYLSSGLIPSGDRTPLFPISRPERFETEMEQLFNCLGPELGPRPDPEKASIERSGTYSEQDMLLRRAAHIPNAPRAVNILESLLLQLHQQPTFATVGPWTQPMQDLALRIRNNPGNNWNFREEIQKIEISLTHFRRIFPQCIGMPPERYLRECRLEMAARLLRETDMSIPEVAKVACIPDIYHFGKLFKNYHCISPGRYRKDMNRNRVKTKKPH